MKRIGSMLLGISLALGSVVTFAQVAQTDQPKTEKKRTDKSKTDEGKGKGASPKGPKSGTKGKAGEPKAQ